MIIYLDKNVYDAALERVRWIFQEFPNVCVASSGGKDSTVVTQLAKMVAKETGRLPLDVMWIDQEAEWQSTVDYMRGLKQDPEIRFHWIQIDMKMSTVTSSQKRYFHVWDPEAEWIRPKEPDSIQDERFGTEKEEYAFSKIFQGFLNWLFPKQKACLLAGVRAEENFARRGGLVYKAKYKYVTWGKIHDAKLEQYTFNPLYDWKFDDIWKAIHAHKWAYNKHYDMLYQYGVKPQEMRVSSIQHETAVRALFKLHEFESDTWNRILTRIQGSNAIAHVGQENFFKNKHVPYMFQNWEEYCCYLIDTLITDEKLRKKYQKKLALTLLNYAKGKFLDRIKRDAIFKVFIQMVRANDATLVKLESWKMSRTKRQGAKIL